jgi:hypothetical protein
VDVRDGRGILESRHWEVGVWFDVRGEGAGVDVDAGEEDDGEADGLLA